MWESFGKAIDGFPAVLFSPFFTLPPITSLNVGEGQLSKKF